MDLAALANLEHGGQLLVVQLREGDRVTRSFAHDGDGIGPPSLTLTGRTAATGGGPASPPERLQPTRP